MGPKDLCRFFLGVSGCGGGLRDGTTLTDSAYVERGARRVASCAAVAGSECTLLARSR